MKFIMTALLTAALLTVTAQASEQEGLLGPAIMLEECGCYTTIDENGIRTTFPGESEHSHSPAAPVARSCKYTVTEVAAPEQYDSPVEEVLGGPILSRNGFLYSLDSECNKILLGPDGSMLNSLLSGCPAALDKQEPAHPCGSCIWGILTKIYGGIMSMEAFNIVIEVEDARVQRIFAPPGIPLCIDVYDMDTLDVDQETEQPESDAIRADMEAAVKQNSLTVAWQA